MIKIGSKPPKFVVNIFAAFRKWKVGRYKQMKVKKEKSLHDRTYFVKFSVKIEDEINPWESKAQYEMVVPAKAAFFAKRRARRALINKINLSFIDCEEMSSKEVENFEKSKNKYVEKKNRTK